VFSSLGDVTGASVLDLYAGSGALAIEALSRGAARALLVDSDRAATEACDANLVATRLAKRARVLRAPVMTVLRGRPPAEAPFDLVSCDPPYDAAAADVADMLDALVQPGWLLETARVVVERAAREPLPSLASPWTVAWERRYGDTLVVVLRASA
jgi:16S rRNA (guanine966-N2)-methyltransferase